VSAVSPSQLRRAVHIADDAETNRVLLGAALENQYHLSFSASGTDCLNKISEDRPDLVLLDVMMPGLNGDEVCYNLKRDSEDKPLKVIIVSSIPNDEYYEMFGHVLADGYITKPVDIDVLLNTITDVLCN